MCEVNCLISADENVPEEERKKSQQLAKEYFELAYSYAKLL
jgi:aminoglycoside phosphotransferase family enzyme